MLFFQGQDRQGNDPQRIHVDMWELRKLLNPHHWCTQLLRKDQAIQQVEVRKEREGFALQVPSRCPELHTDAL